MNTDLITFKEAASMMGMAYETLRRQRAMGYMGEIRIFKATPQSREKVVKQSVLDFIKKRTERAA